MRDKQMAYCEEEQKDVDYRAKKLKEQKDKISLGMLLYKWDKAIKHYKDILDDKSF